MQQIADWLKKLGMSEYAQRFAENGKNLEALRYLTDQDLRDIGVLLGHRRIMLAATGELAGSAVSMPLCAPAIEPKPKGAPENAAILAAATSSAAANSTGERRYLTVMSSTMSNQ